MTPEAQRIAIAEAQSANRLALFMQKVVKTDFCWLWTGAKSGSGYGQFWDGERNISAHHFLLDVKPVGDLQACHKCDNKLCVNPAHIFVGTHADNERDKVAKGRHNTAPGCYAMLLKRDSYGSRNSQSKLSEEQVAVIKTTPKTRGSGRRLANMFGVTEACISAIRCGVNRLDESQRAEAFLRTIGKWEDDIKA